MEKSPLTLWSIFILSGQESSWCNLQWFLSLPVAGLCPFSSVIRLFLHGFSLLSQIHLILSYPDSDFFLPFSKEKSKQNNLGAYIGREDGIRRVLKHWNNRGESSKLTSGEQRLFLWPSLRPSLSWVLPKFLSAVVGECLITPHTSAVFTKHQCGSEGWQKVLEAKQLPSITAASWSRGGILDAKVESNNTDFHQEQNILICYEKEKQPL